LDEVVARLSDLGYTAQKLPGPLLLATTGGNRQVPKLMPPCTLPKVPFGKSPGDHALFLDIALDEHDFKSPDTILDGIRASFLTALRADSPDAPEFRNWPSSPPWIVESHIDAKLRQPTEAKVLVIFRGSGRSGRPPLPRDYT
jgi:hypothetical protein